MSKSVWAWDCTTYHPKRVLKPKQHGDVPHEKGTAKSCGTFAKLASIGGFRLFCTLILSMSCDQDD